MSLAKVFAQRKGGDPLPSSQRPLPIKKYSKKTIEYARISFDNDVNFSPIIHYLND